MGLMFFPGLHQPSDAKHFDLACISIHRLLERKKPLGCGRLMIDSGAFTILDTHGCYPEEPEAYAALIYRLWINGTARPTVVVAQDYMCEPRIRQKTGLSIAAHQWFTVERYDDLLDELHRLFGPELPFEVMPVIQGWEKADYLRHITLYGDRLKPGMWVGVGSVCKRQGDVAEIEGILRAIKEARPDLRLHGFRCEAHGAEERHRARPPLQRRQHGVELQRPKARPQRERLARGEGVRRQGLRRAA